MPRASGAGGSDENDPKRSSLRLSICTAANGWTLTRSLGPLPSAIFEYDAELNWTLHCHCESCRRATLSADDHLDFCATRVILGLRQAWSPPAPSLI